MANHSYTARIVWTGNRGQGTASYRGYDRTWNVETPGKPVINCSNDPLLGGDPGLHNPEDMLISALSACHMLWFLHLASEAGWVVESYEDQATGTMEMNRDGSGQFTEAVLRPAVTISDGNPALSDDLHERAHEKCFVARSVNFPGRCVATVSVIEE